MNEIQLPWLRFKHHIVRQLAFALASPNLILNLANDWQNPYQVNFDQDDQWQQYFQQYLARLSQLDLNPEPLSRFLEQTQSTRLGIRFEQLLYFWLTDGQSRYHPYQLKAHRLQRMDAQRTIGEIDFLIHNENSGQLEHWEVALKYYLAEAPFQLQNWIGLNRQDCLARKLKHSLNHQFFSNADSNIATFNIQHRRLILKGQLYTPFNTDLANIKSINPDAVVGHWCNRLPKDTNHWRRLNRDEWLGTSQNHRQTVNPKWWCNGLYLKQLHQNYEFLMLRIQT